MNTNKYIGGNFSSVDLNDFELNPNESQIDVFFPEKLNNLNRVFFETGADVLASIIKEVDIKNENCVVWFPENYCQETINRVLLKSDNLITKRFNSLSFLFSNAVSSDIIILIHFNRFDKNIVDAINTLKSKNRSVIIEDFVHCPFDIVSFSADYAFNSLRKVVDVEIAVAYKRNNVAYENIDSKYLNTKNEAARLKTVYFETGNIEIEKSFLKLFVEAEESLKTEQIQGPSRSQLDKLKTVDITKTKLIRAQNFKYLKSQMSMISDIEILEGDYMFLMISCQNRDRLRKHLFNQHIFSPIHWLDSNTEISKRILSLPIDQRYTTVDMDRIALEVRSFYNQIS